MHENILKPHAEGASFVGSILKSASATGQDRCRIFSLCSIPALDSDEEVYMSVLASQRFPEIQQPAACNDAKGTRVSLISEASFGIPSLE